MTDTNGMAEAAQATARNASEKVLEKVSEMGDKASETFRNVTDKVNQAAKDGLNTAGEFAQTAQKLVEQSGLGGVDVREIVKREPWIALGVAFAAGYITAQIIRRRPE